MLREALCVGDGLLGVHRGGLGGLLGREWRFGLGGGRGGLAFEALVYYSEKYILQLHRLSLAVTSYRIDVENG